MQALLESVFIGGSECEGARMDHDTAADGTAAQGRAAAAAVREQFAAYVHAVHQRYAETARDCDVDPSTLPLGGEPFTVAVVATGQLHLVATRDPLPPVADHEQLVDGAVDELSWQVRFLDATVLPELAGVRDPTAVPPEPTELLGVDTVLYRLATNGPSELSSHQATHAGAGLADAHLRAAG